SLTMSTYARFSFCRGNITRLRERPRAAIVTIANNFLIPNIGIDMEIREAGGLPLEEAVAQKRQQDLARILCYDTGQAVITTSGNLPVENVLHAVIQPIMGTSSDEVFYLFEIRHILREMYHSIITVAREGNIDELLIPLIHPMCLSIDECITIGLHGMSEQCKQVSLN
ncbi:hypothetical protein PMAYCL1PPCAC_16819, partial [Pristionchus mayeri]